jgi:hypothetical protein
VVRRAVFVFALAGCGDVSEFQCSADADCTDRDGIVGTCADPGFCAFSDSSCPSGLRYDTLSAGALSGQCVDPMTGPLGDTPDHPLQLLPSQQVDVTKAHDDYCSKCNGMEDVDIFFEVTLGQQSRLYVDTLGTDFAVQLSVIPSACASVQLDCPTSGPDNRNQQCFDHVCTNQPKLQQYSDILDAGTYCIVMDRVAGDTNTNLVVRSMIGPPAATGAIGNNDGNTCGNDDWTSTCAASGLPDQTWFFSSCTPTTYIVDACSSFDGDFQGWGLGATQISCGDGATGIDVQLLDPGPAWIVAEASSTAACGNVCAAITQ